MAIQPPPNIFLLVQGGSPIDVIWQQLRHHQVPPFNNQYQTLLFAAVQRKDPSDALVLCERLVRDYGVDAAHMDRRGQTALHYLAKTAHTECVDVLLASGAKVDHIDLLMRQTPLFYAARYGTPAMVQSLLSHQADPNRRDARGMTPMFWASNPDVCKVLVGFGALCDVCDNNGISVADHHERVAHEIEDQRRRWMNERQGLTEKALATAAAIAAAQGNVIPSEAAILKEQGTAFFLGMCETVRSIASRRQWSISTDDVNGGKLAYVISHSVQQDVDRLCEVEDEFIEDHKRLFEDGSLTTAEIIEQIGLNPCADSRRNTVRSIAHTQKRTGKVRHHTLKCECVERDTAQTPPDYVHKIVVVGYIYFRIVEKDPADAEKPDVPLCTKDDIIGGGSSSSSNSGVVSNAGSAGTTSGKGLRKCRMDKLGHIVVSHLKVDNRHRNRGVGKLLLASMLAFVEADRRNTFLTDIFLSVIGRNVTALGLYQKLGFVDRGGIETKEGEVPSEWIEMRRPLGHIATVDELAAEWLTLVPGFTTAPLDAASAIALAAKKKKAAAKKPATALSRNFDPACTRGTSPARGSKPALLDGEPAVSLKRPRSPDRSLDLGPSPIRNGFAGKPQVIAAAPPGKPQVLPAAPPGKPQVHAAAPPGKPQVLADAPPGKPQVLAAAPPGKPQVLPAAPLGKPHVLAAAPPGKPHVLAAAPPGKPQVFPGVPPGKPQVLVAATPGKPQVHAAATPGKPQVLAAAPPAKPQLLAAATPGKPQLLAVATPGKPQLLDAATPKL